MLPETDISYKNNNIISTVCTPTHHVLYVPDFLLEQGFPRTSELYSNLSVHLGIASGVSVYMFMYYNTIICTVCSQQVSGSRTYVHINTYVLLLLIIIL